jgi:predicted RND superfamily exporter protein
MNQESLTEIEKFEKKILENPNVKSSSSIVSIFTMISYYFGTLPNESSRAHFERVNPVFKSSVESAPIKLINHDESKTRISSQIKDIGTDKINFYASEIQNWFDNTVDTSVYGMRYTGTGLVIDKNAKYVRESLLKGLAFALIIIGILMGFLFKSFKMVLISFIPNTIPLLIAAAILGFTGIPLEPLTSITFVVIFGIAVDDTIHFLSKYRLALHSGKSLEEALLVSFQESGKAIIFTTIVLFFGFMVMLLSYNPSSVIVGGLISITLFTAVFADLMLLPVLLRKFHIR